MAGITSTATTTTASATDSTVIIIAYVCGAAGLILVLGIGLFIFRKVRFSRAKKYIKEQSKRSIGMGPKLTSPAPVNPWKWSLVKAGIKARQKERAAVHTASIATIVRYGDETEMSHSDISVRPQSSKPTTEKPSDDGNQVIHTAFTLKHERLQVRREAKQAKLEKRARIKEVKKIVAGMMKGEHTVVANPTPATHVGPLRRESLSAIPTMTYLIERSRTNTRSTGEMQPQIPQILEEERGASNYLSPRNKGAAKPSARGQTPRPYSGRSNKNLECEVTVHHITDRGNSYESDLESVSSQDGRPTTEL